MLKVKQKDQLDSKFKTLSNKNLSIKCVLPSFQKNKASIETFLLAHLAKIARAPARHPT